MLCFAPVSCRWSFRSIRSLTTRLASRLAVIALFASLLACSDSTTVNIHTDRLSVPLPSTIRQVAVFNPSLQFQVTINGEVVRQTTVDGDTGDVEVVVNIPAEQNNELEFAWFAIIDGQPVLLADFSTVVLAGTTEIDIESYNSNGPRFDDDGDGRSNLNEARENRNPFSPIDLEVPRQQGFGGAFATLSDTGIDTDTSGDPWQPEADTRFALRHDGDNLVVYVCGQDRNLLGDNTATDGQYWHDDVVFIYIDGSDNDSGSYDGEDDFQLAFVRDTQELIISKGPDNFCPAGNCISHLFFNNVSSCEYELRVDLPLSDMNITVGQNVGFDLEITDDDNGDLREGSLGWIGFDDASNLDPSTFGTILLME